MLPSQKENLLRYIWQYRAYELNETTDGRQVVVLRNGRETGDGDGTCFCEAEITIDGVPMKGTVRCCESSSAWNRQMAQRGEIPETILLIVADNDCSPVNASPEEELNIIVSDINPLLEQKLESLIHSGMPLCGTAFLLCNTPRQYSILTRLMLERLDDKRKHIMKAYKRYGESWNDVAKYLLFDTACITQKENRNQLQILFSKIYDSALLGKIQSLEDAESLVFGLAGLLDLSNHPDNYHYRLRTKFEKLQLSYRLEPVNIRLWKFGYTGNPSSLWFILAQIAAILYRYDDLAGSLANSCSLEELKKLFRTEPSPYWSNHHYLSAPETEHTEDRRISETKADIFIINMAVPFIFSCREQQEQESEETESDSILEMLEQIPPENNTFVRHWAKYIPADNALTSQAIVQLSKKYCTARACYRCPLGRLFLQGE